MAVKSLVGVHSHTKQTGVLSTSFADNSPGQLDKHVRTSDYLTSDKNTSLMLVMGTSKSEREPQRRGGERGRDLPSQVPKLPRALSNSQPPSSSNDGLSSGKISTPHLPRLLGSLPKSITTSDITNRDTMLLGKQESTLQLRAEASTGSTLLPTLEDPRPPSDLPEGQPLWDWDLTSHEARSLSKRIPQSAVSGPAVSEGFWRSMKFTPGEMDLKYNRNQNSHRRASSSQTAKVRPERTSLPMTKSKPPPTVLKHESLPIKGIPIVHQGPIKMPDALEATRQNQMIYDKFAREQPTLEVEDPDRLNMGHIIHALQDQMTESFRERGLSPRRQESRYGDTKTSLNPPSTVQMALKASRRYRHPEKTAANFPSAPQSSADYSILNAGKPTGVEKALKHSSTYEIQQRNKRNKEATQSDIRRYYGSRSNASQSRSMSLYALSLPLEAEPYSLQGLTKKRARSLQPQQKVAEGGEDQDWRMNMSPTDWVKLLKANPGDPIFKRLGIEKEGAKPETKKSDSPLQILPASEDYANDADSFVIDAPLVPRPSSARSGSGDHRPRSRGATLDDIEQMSRSPPKTPVPFNSPETSPRRGESLNSSVDETETIKCLKEGESSDKDTKNIGVSGGDLNRGDSLTLEENNKNTPQANPRNSKSVQTKSEPIKPSLSKSTTDGSQGPLKSNKRVVIVVPLKNVEHIVSGKRIR